MHREIPDAYSRDAGDLIPRYEALDPGQFLAPVADLLHNGSGKLLDVGAGTGNTAAWLADLGYAVTAAEPARRLREWGMSAYSGPRIAWIDDCLPGLQHIRDAEDRYSIILLSAVWHHLRSEWRAAAMQRLAGLLRPGGLLILSLRHGPGAPGRPAYECSAEETCSQARAEGLNLLRQLHAGAIQAQNKAAGVSWTWLVFQAGKA